MKKILTSVILCFSILTSLAGCGIESAEVMNIDGEKVTLSEYNYYLNNMKLQAERSVSPEEIDMYWDTEKDGKTTFEIMKEKAYEEMEATRICAKEAEKMGITYDQNVLQTASSIRKQMLSVTQSEEEFYKTMNTDSETIVKISKMYALRSALLQKLTETGEFKISEDDIKRVFNEKYFKAQHILLMTVDSNTNTPLSDEEKANKKKKAEELLQRAKSGEDFSTLMNEFSEDPGSKSQPGGYVFTEGEMVPQFEEATKNLAVNQISDIVETSYGYHIIKRLPLSADEATEDLQKATENIQTTLMTEFLDDKVVEWKKDFKITENKSVIDNIKRKK